LVSSAHRLWQLHDKLTVDFDMKCVALHELSRFKPSEINVVDIDLREATHVQAVKRWLDDAPPQRKVILCVGDDNSRIQIVQACALGATGIVSGPIVSNVSRHLSTIKAALGAAEPAENFPGLGALQAMFGKGDLATVPEASVIKQASAEVVSELEQVGLRAFLGMIRQHHSRTYQHCLSVTAIAVSFGEHLKFNRHDVEKLAFAGLLHDIGKSRIPVGILEKPSALDEAEEEVMKTHPAIGYDLLRENPEFSAEMLDMVLHHHEYLDGSGYPHGLKDNEISDLVRIITIADICGALIERRAYKSPLSGSKALEILQTMDGKLDSALVREFEPVIRNLA